jgi:putative hydrolase of the HAD superfamily
VIKAVIFDMFETLITHYSCPLYFGEQISADMGITNQEFQAIWKPTDEQRTIGLMTFEEVIEIILKKHNCYSEELLQRITAKRISTKQLCFDNLNPEIVPMLKEIKKSNRKIALISNCFSEEVAPIKQSSLSQYFDKMYLSFEQGMKKPDERIFRKCAEELEVALKECLYIGDGGSDELEAARNVGMTALQAGWYLRQSGQLADGRNDQFQLLNTPNDVLLHLG